MVIDPNRYFVIDVNDTIMLPGAIRSYLLSNSDNLCISYHSIDDLNYQDVIESHFSNVILILGNDFSLLYLNIIE